MENGDREDWTSLSLPSLERAYSSDEPEFSLEMIKEEVSAMLQLDFLEKEAKLGSQEAFEDYLANVPNTPPTHAEDAVK